MQDRITFYNYCIPNPHCNLSVLYLLCFQIEETLILCYDSYLVCVMLQSGEVTINQSILINRNVV